MHTMFQILILTFCVKVLTKTNQILIKCLIHFIKHDFKNACFDTTYISNVGTV